MAGVQEDIRKFKCEWITVDKKKLSASTHADAATIMLGAYMHERAFKTILKGNTPSAKEKEMFVFKWEHITKINISRKKPISELTFSLNKQKCKHTSVVVATTVPIFEEIYEILNFVLFHIINDKKKSDFAKKSKNVKILGSFDMQRGDEPTNSGTFQQKPRACLNIDDFINNMLRTLDQNELGKNVRVVLAELPEDGTILDTEGDDGPEENKDEVPQETKDEASEDNKDVVSEEGNKVVTCEAPKNVESKQTEVVASGANENLASVKNTKAALEVETTAAAENQVSEENTNEAPEENKNEDPEENKNEASNKNENEAFEHESDSNSQNKMDCEFESIRLAPPIEFALDLYQFLNVPFAIVVIMTLLVKIFFYILFNQVI